MGVFGPQNEGSAIGVRDEDAAESRTTKSLPGGFSRAIGKATLGLWCGPSETHLEAGRDLPMNFQKTITPTIVIADQPTHCRPDFSRPRASLRRQLQERRRARTADRHGCRRRKGPGSWPRLHPHGRGRKSAARSQKRRGLQLYGEPCRRQSFGPLSQRRPGRGDRLAPASPGEWLVGWRRLHCGKALGLDVDGGLRVIVETYLSDHRKVE